MVTNKVSVPMFHEVKYLHITTCARCTDAIQNELGIDSVVFSQPSTSAQDLIRDIHSVCGERQSLTVNDANFLRLFKLHNNQNKILMVTAKGGFRKRSGT